MANFYPIKQPKLIRVKNFFSHLPFITSQQHPTPLSSRVQSEQSHSIISLLQRSKIGNSKQATKARSYTRDHKTISHEVDAQNKKRQKERSRNLSIVSKLLLLQLQDEKYLRQQHRSIVKGLRFKIQKEQYMKRQLKKKINMLNLTIDSLNERENELVQNRKLIAKRIEG